jgi:predicted exporter
MRPIVLIVTLCAAGFIVSRSNNLWSEELSSMSPISTADQHLDRDLRRDIGAPDVRYLIIATASTREALLETCERTGAMLQTLVAQGALAGFDTPVRYLPSVKTQQMRRSALPDRTTLANNLKLALTGTPFREAAFASFLDEVEAARTTAPVTRDSLNGTALSLKLDSLLVERPDRWVATLPLRDVHHPQRISAALTASATSASASTVFLDLKSESDLLLQRYRHEALILALLGSMAITALLFAYFRSFQQTAITLAPLVVSVIVTVALLILMHGKLSIFNLFGLLLVIAVSSNYCLFFQRGGMLGEAGGRTITSLLAANVCTVVGFGALSISRMPVLYDIGRTVAIGTAISLVTASILIPHVAATSSRTPVQLP